MSKVILLVLSKVMILVGICNAFGQDIGDRTLSYSVSCDSVVGKDQVFDFYLTLSVKPEWYIYAPTGRNSAQGMIETKVTFDLPVGISKLGKIVTPDPIYKDGHEIYEGNDVVFKQKMRISPSMKFGRYSITGKVTWQSCSHSICLPPVTDLFTVEVEVVRDSLQEFGTVDLKFTSLDHRDIDISRLNAKLILIDCWATWCVPCLKEIPRIRELYGKYRGLGLEVIGICMDESSAKDRVKDMVKSNNITWPQRFEGQGMHQDTFAKEHNILMLPTVYLIDPKGRIISANARGDSLEPLIRKFLGL